MKPFYGESRKWPTFSKTLFPKLIGPIKPMLYLFKTDIKLSPLKNLFYIFSIFISALIPKFTEKEESIIFHATKNSQNFRTKKIRLNEKDKREIYIGSEVGQKIKQSQDNLIFDCPTVSMTHAVILLTKNGLKNKYFLQDLKSTNGTLINSVKTEKGRRHQLKSG